MGSPKNHQSPRCRILKMKKGILVGMPLAILDGAGLCFGDGFYRNERLVFSFLFEYNHTVGEGEQGVILAHAYIFAGVVLGAALTNDDVAGDYFLTAEHLNTKAFAF